jgi:hypothetical protein
MSAAPRFEQRRERIAAEQRVGGERVGAESRDGAERRRRLADQALRVCLRRHRHIAALAVGQHEQAVLARGRDGVLERDPAARPEPLETGELQLDRHACGRGCLDDGTAMRRDGLVNGLGPDRDLPQT